MIALIMIAMIIILIIILRILILLIITMTMTIMVGVVDFECYFEGTFEKLASQVVSLTTKCKIISKSIFYCLAIIICFITFEMEGRFTRPKVSTC